jgi:hypothetical protein
MGFRKWNRRNGHVVVVEYWAWHSPLVWDEADTKIGLDDVKRKNKGYGLEISRK